MLTIPAATSRRLVNSPEMMAIVATLLGVISVVLGIYLSVEIDAPSGPSIVVVNAVLFFLSHIFAIFVKKQ